MALFAKFGRTAFKPVQTTIIATGTAINGEIRNESDLHIDGELHGPLHAEGRVSIGKSGKIKGDITARQLIVSGCFIGEADCEEIRILSDGKVTGKLSCYHLTIEKGGILNGQNIHKEPLMTVKPMPLNPRIINKSNAA